MKIGLALKLVQSSLVKPQVAGSVPTIGDFHTVGPCKKAVFACLATDVKIRYLYLYLYSDKTNNSLVPAFASQMVGQAFNLVKKFIFFYILSFSFISWKKSLGINPSCLSDGSGFIRPQLFTSDKRSG